jgi:hypothetical protein
MIFLLITYKNLNKFLAYSEILIKPEYYRPNKLNTKVETGAK